MTQLAEIQKLNANLDRNKPKDIDVQTVISIIYHMENVAKQIGCGIQRLLEVKAKLEKEKPEKVPLETMVLIYFHLYVIADDMEYMDTPKIILEQKALARENKNKPASNFVGYVITIHLLELAKKINL